MVVGKISRFGVRACASTGGGSRYDEDNLALLCAATASQNIRIVVGAAWLTQCQIPTARRRVYFVCAWDLLTCIPEIFADIGEMDCTRIIREINQRKFIANERR